MYGTKSTHRLMADLPNPCLHCRSTRTVQMHVLQRYGHVYGMPFIPIGKVVVSECTQCKQVLTENEMSPSWKADAKALKIYARVPFWTFSGLIVAVLLVAAVAWMSNTKASYPTSWIVTPQKGEVYEDKTE